jgi:hypothetical protein
MNLSPVKINDHELRILICDDENEREDAVFTVFEKKIPNREKHTKMLVTYNTKVGGWHGLTKLNLTDVKKFSDDKSGAEIENPKYFNKEDRAKFHSCTVEAPGYFKN